MPAHVTVTDWFRYWIKNIVCDLAPNTLRNYEERFRHNIKSYIKRLMLGDVKPMIPWWKLSDCSKIAEMVQKP